MDNEKLKGVHCYDEKLLLRQMAKDFGNLRRAA
jgi:hypothetical protein